VSIMNANYAEHVKAVDKRVGALAKASPKVMGAYGQLAQAVMGDGALDTKTKELMALAISVVIRCDDCIAYHTRAAIKQGASKQEVTESLGVAVELGGGPCVVYSAKALSAYVELSD